MVLLPDPPAGSPLQFLRACPYWVWKRGTLRYESYPPAHANVLAHMPGLEYVWLNRT